MKSTLKLTAIVLVVSLIGGFVGGLVGGNQSDRVGSAGTRFIHGLSVNTNTASTGNGLLVGTNGTELDGIKTGACTIWAPATTISATTTQQVECQNATDGSISAITGITTDSICQLAMASSTSVTSGSLAIGGVSASSTAGTLVVRLINLTGTTFTWSSTASSSRQWNYMCFDPN